ncbi:hypothetical protein EDB80DRAFT_749804 [Ilyonectria destructans]|nr:hypothetical protein EDB80DRAFT_749804 [Ilyonectria destructans]
MAFLGHLAIRETFNSALTLTILLIAVSQFNFGFDQLDFKVYFLESWWLSLFTSLRYIGFGSGILIGSTVSKHFGRRMCMFSMSVWSCIATTIIITSKNRNQILAARILAYIYIGMELAVVPIYQAEITPRRPRGFVVGTYQLSLAIGGLVVNCVARRTGDIQSPAAYFIIYGLFYILPVIVIGGIWLVPPESPRWLAMKGRNEDALMALRRLRKRKFEEQDIQVEMAHTISGVDNETEKGTLLTCSETSKKLNAHVYGAYFVKQLGFINPFIITCVGSATQILAVTISMVLVDKLGRRHDARDGLRSGIGWGPISHTISAEIPSMRFQDVTYRTASVVNIVTQFVVAFTLPYLLNAPYAALGSKVGFIFRCGVILAGRTLEEIDILFL